MTKIIVLDPKELEAREAANKVNDIDSEEMKVH
jgi:hypothetical protein